jgi:C4-dicarboxylate-specific signal transduction histidine kinase
MAGAAGCRRIGLDLLGLALLSVQAGAVTSLGLAPSGQAILDDSGSDGQILDRWSTSAIHSASALVALVTAVALWTVRERRMSSHRRAIHRLYSLSEEMTSASLPSEHLKRLQATIPELLRVTDVRLYVLDRSSGTLQAVALEESTGPGSERLEVDEPFRKRAVESCYSNRSMLFMPDTRRSPFILETSGNTPRSALFVPMFAGGELRGVLEIDHATRIRQFSQDEQAIAQHLANQVAIGLKLAEQRDTQLRLFHSEKLAATGQLVSNVARELQSPLVTIANLAETVLLGDTASPAQRELRAISAKARSALDTVRRLLNLARSGEEDTQAVSASALLRRLLDLRKRRWQESGIDVTDCLPTESVAIECSPSHLEHVLASLLGHVEMALAETTEKNLTIRSSRLGARVQLEIAAAGGCLRWDRTATVVGDKGIHGLALCRSILRSHEGDLRIVEGTGGGWRIEIELPAARTAAIEHTAPASEGAGRALTALLVDPDVEDRRALVTLLDGMGHRVVPVASAEEGAAMLGRMRFHVTFCSVHLPGQNWLQFMRRVQAKTSAFVLVTEGYDAEFEQAVAEKDGFILAKPFHLPEVKRVLESVDARLPAAAR